MHSLAPTSAGFDLTLNEQIIRTPAALLATGVLDRHPPIADLRAVTLAGAVRWCPICDGYEVQDKHVGLLSPPREGYKHALFLRTYTGQLSWFVQGDAEDLDEEALAKLADLNIRVIRSAITDIRVVHGPQVTLSTHDGGSYVVDTLYPMMGCQPRVELLEELEPRQDKSRQLWADEHQQTSIRGIYAAGDIVHALNQMSVGAAHAATAATAIHNVLPKNYRQ